MTGWYGSWPRPFMTRVTSTACPVWLTPWRRRAARTPTFWNIAGAKDRTSGGAVSSILFWARNSEGMVLYWSSANWNLSPLAVAAEVHRHASAWLDDAEILAWFGANLQRVCGPSLRY